jgi:ABC-type transport system substrate-binding protein
MRLRNSFSARVAVALALALVASIVVGATAFARTEATPRKGGTLRVAILADILNLDPYSRALQQYTITKVVYEPLVEFDATFKPRPALATKWSFNKALTAINIQLRRGVVFHSGAPLNADAVVANFKRARNATTGQHMFFFTSVVKDASATAQYTVHLEFNNPTPVPLVLDTLQSLPIVDPGYFDKLSREASGTGPYKLVNWTPGQSITLAPNTKWWGGEGAPYLNRLQFVLFSDPSAAVAALQSGAVSMVQDLDPTRAKNLVKSGFSVIPGAPGALTLEWRLNPRKAPFDSQTFRRVINYAVDRAGIVKAIRGGYGKPIVTPWYTHDTAYETKLLKAYRYNLAKVASIAKALPDSSFKIMLTPAFPDTIQVAQIIQAAFRSVGVKVDLDEVDSATYTKRLVAGDFQSTVSYGSGGQHYPSQVTFGSAWRTTNNALWGTSVPSSYLKAISAAQEALTKQDQERALRQLQNASLVMASVILIADRPTLFTARKNVQGFATTVDSMPLFGKVWLGG